MQGVMTLDRRGDRHASCVRTAVIARPRWAPDARPTERRSGRPARAPREPGKQAHVRTLGKFRL